jgi:hypothetical protein
MFTSAHRGLYRATSFSILLTIFELTALRQICDISEHFIECITNIDKLQLAHARCINQPTAVLQAGWSLYGGLVDHHRARRCNLLITPPKYLLLWVSRLSINPEVQWFVLSIIRLLAP